MAIQRLTSMHISRHIPSFYIWFTLSLVGTICHSIDAQKDSLNLLSDTIFLEEEVLVHDAYKNTLGTSTSKLKMIDGMIGFWIGRSFFKRNMGDNNQGLVLQTAYHQQIKENAPLFWGAGIQFATIATRSTIINELLDNRFEDFDYSTSTVSIHMLGYLRYYLPFTYWGIEPYTQIGLGTQWIFSTTSKTLIDTDNGDTSWEKGSLAPMYIIGAGVNIPLRDQLYLQIHVSLMESLSTSYYAPSIDQTPLSPASSLDLMTLRQSQIRTIQSQIGVVYFL